MHADMHGTFWRTCLVISRSFQEVNTWIKVLVYFIFHFWSYFFKESPHFTCSEKKGSSLPWRHVEKHIQMSFLTALFKDNFLKLFPFSYLLTFNPICVLIFPYRPLPPAVHFSYLHGLALYAFRTHPLRRVPEMTVAWELSFFMYGIRSILGK